MRKLHEHFSRRPTISVVGLGYIGLPTASIFATNEFDVIGVDTDPSVVETVNAGNCHLDEPGLRTLVNAAVNSGRLEATTELQPADIFIVTVPTPLQESRNGRGCDYSAITSAVEGITDVCERDNLIILESTVPPETTQNYIVRPLEKAGYTPGENIFAAHCPERVLPGRILKELTQNDRIVGGICETSAELSEALYREVIDGDVVRTDATTSETVKLIENTYRDVNIALANELADICDNLSCDADDVIELANRHPRVAMHRPGPGVGGHCLPIDPWFLIQAVEYKGELIETARRTNETTPARLAESVAERLQEVSNSPSCAVLGVSYKGNVDDTRMTPARPLIQKLTDLGVDVTVTDPRVENFDYPLVDLGEAVENVDGMIIAAAHREFEEMSPWALKETLNFNCIFDFCNLLEPDEWRAAGFIYHGRGIKRE